MFFADWLTNKWARLLPFSFLQVRMDHRHYSPAGLSESELDESSSTASSPMSISSAEASSPYDSSRLHVGDEDPTDSSFSTSVSSPPPSPAESTQSSTTTSCSNNNYQWSSNPYNNGSKSVRWFRDDRGLWSERSSNRRNSPYSRTTTPSSNKHHLEHKEVSEVLIDAVQREDQNQLRHLLAKSAAHVNVLGQEGDSPLHRSCRQGNLDTVKLLVSFLLLFPFPVNWFVHVIFNDFLISLIDKIGSLRSRSGISQPRGMEPTALGRTQRMRRRRCLPFVPHAAAVIKNRLLLDSSSCCCCRMSQVKYSWMAFECCWNPESLWLAHLYCLPLIVSELHFYASCALVKHSSTLRTTFCLLQVAEIFLPQSLGFRYVEY